MFSKTHGIIALDLSRTQDISIVRKGTVQLEGTFAELVTELTELRLLTESILLISLNQFETY